jgi:hypothetical protein
MPAPQNKAVSILLEQLGAHVQKFLDYGVSQGLPEPSFENGDGFDPLKPLPVEIEVTPAPSRALGTVVGRPW